MKYKLIYGVHVLIGDNSINHEELFAHLQGDDKKKAIAEAKLLSKPDKPEKVEEVK